MEFKLFALQLLRNNNVSETAKVFGVDRKQVWQWNEMRHVLIVNQTGNKKREREKKKKRFIQVNTWYPKN